MSDEELSQIQYEMCNNVLNFIMDIFHASVKGHAFDSEHTTIARKIYLDSVQEIVAANFC